MICAKGISDPQTFVVLSMMNLVATGCGQPCKKQSTALPYMRRPTLAGMEYTWVTVRNFEKSHNRHHGHGGFCMDVTIIRLEGGIHADQF